MRGGLTLNLAIGSLSCALGLVARPAAADQPGPPTKPFLRIEAEMHTAMIRRIDMDGAGKRLVTASEDKTARIWDLETGRLLRILRPPIGDGNEGKLYAASFSPDGKTVAVGGWTEPRGQPQTIYLFDASSGQIRGRISGLPQGAYHLSYSKDGSRLAVALGGPNGIRVYRVRDLKMIWEDKDYGDNALWVEFDRRGRLVATSYDGDVRLYRRDFRLLARRTVPYGKRPFSARFSPDGKFVAVSLEDSPTIAVLDGDTLLLRHAPDVSGLQGGNLMSVGWSADGRRLYAGGTNADGRGQPIFGWTAAGTAPRVAVAHSTNSIMDIRTVDENRIVFATAAPHWGVVDANGRTLLDLGPPIVDHRDNADKLKVSSAGDQFQFGFDVYQKDMWTRRLARFDLEPRTLVLDPKDAPGAITPPRTTGLPIQDWKDSKHPTLSGGQILLVPYETSRSLAIARDNRHFLLGTEWYLRFFGQTGKQLWESPIPGPAWAVNLTGDGRWAMAALGDGTIRWYATADGEERLAFFPHPDGKRWIVWTPEGFFAASPGAETLAGYHLNQGADKAGEFVALDQLSDLFYRPDLVTHALEVDAPQRMQTALARIGDVRRVLASGLPPAVEIARDRIRQNGDEVTLPVQVQDRGGGMGRLVYRVNGVELAARGEVPGIPGQGPVTVRIPLPVGHSVVTVSAYNGKGEIESRPVELAFDVATPKRVSRTLHVLAAGVTHYRDHSLQLKYASADALAIAAAIEEHAKGLFDRVNVPSPLVDGQVTYENLKQAFEKLAPEVQPDDVFIFYAAGHGAVRDGRYFLLPADLRYANDDEFQRAAIDETELQGLLAKIRAQRSLVLLDTCSAGAFGQRSSLLASRSGLDEKAALDRLMKATGRAILGAAADGRMALEGYEGHGVFTAALLHAFALADKKKRLVDRNGDGMVDVQELASFLADEVPRMTQEKFQYEQFPMSRLEMTQGKPFPVSKSHDEHP